MMVNQNDSICPICDIKCPLYLKTWRTYFQCNQCYLIFVSLNELPTLDDEKKRYQHHNNSDQNLGYRNFLSPTIDAVKNNIDPGRLGLDYGCGPTPALATWLKQDGFPCHYWDPIFFPNLPFDSYQFITMTEVIEHIHRPLDTFKKIQSLLAPNGILFVQTKLVLPEIDFANWHYQRDFTHVHFYSPHTINHLAHLFNVPIQLTASSL